MSAGEKLKKGQILVVKVPPFFDHEYYYEVIAAGGKLIRVTLHKSPRVKKHWTVEEFDLLVEHGMVRLATPSDLETMAAHENELVENAGLAVDGDRDDTEFN